MKTYWNGEGKAAMRSLTNNVRVAELLSDRIIGKHIMGIDS